MRVPSLSLAVAGGLLLAMCAACSERTGWPPDAVQKFTATCVANGTKTGATAAVAAARCDCLLAKVRAHYTAEDWAGVVARMADGKNKPPADVVEAIRACMK
jgi:hypothetical protein